MTTAVGLLIVLTPSVASAAVTVTTEPTSSFDKNAAYVCGQWTSDRPGNIEFQYGLDTSYGSVAGYSSTDIGQTSGSDCIMLGGLTPSTTYHYRFVFLYPETGYSCPCIEYDGSDQTFTTQTGSAPEITGPTTATPWETNIGFSVSTGVDAEGYPTTWQVDYGTSPSDLSSSTTPQNVVVSPNGPDAVFTDVPSNGTPTLPTDAVYYWQIVATNTLGTTKSAISSITLGTLSYLLTVSKTGVGSGIVMSSPIGIACGLACSYGYSSGTVVTLAATPAGGSMFAGWSGGGCSGTGTCAVTIDQAQTVFANFNAVPPPPAPPEMLTVHNYGTGSGTVTSSPSGITCGSTCSYAFDWATKVTLSATPASGSTFSGWAGTCSGTGTSCSVTMDQAREADVVFASKPAACAVPKVRDKTLTAAEKAIRKAHCAVGKISHSASRTVKRDHVISQKPGPARRLKHGAKVNLLVSKGRG